MIFIFNMFGMHCIEEHLWNQVFEATLPLEYGRVPNFFRDISDVSLKVFRFALSFPFALVMTVVNLPWHLRAKAPKVMAIPKDDLASAVQGRVFLHGAAICDYQATGMDRSPHSNWADYERRHLRKEIQSGDSIQLLDRQDEVIANLRELGVNSYRFSLDMAKICPQKGVFDEAALQRYVAFFDKLIAAGIQPRVCLYHWTHSLDFEKRGGFEREENIQEFVDYCTFVARKLPQGIYVDTINEVGVYPFLGWILGKGPPKKVMNFTKGALVVQNLLNAHNRAYRAIKRVREDLQVGLTHQYLKFIAGSHFTKPMCYALSQFVNQLVLRALKGRVPHLKVPFLANIRLKVEPLLLDHFGVQAYVQPLVTCKGSVAEPGGAMTEMEFRENPQAVYHAIKAVSKARNDLPIFVTETGIATQAPSQRKRFYQRVMACVARAMNEGMNVRGLYWWSSHDNFEWSHGMDTIHFGLFSALKEEAYQRKKGTSPICRLSKQISCT